jgi:ATP-dependent exoDNAse (exonuclease V) alpha subunit
VPMFRLAMYRISRASGRSAPAAAAYRAGESIRDERTGKLHNYSRRTDVTHTEIFLPSDIQKGEAEWARDRSQLWNAAEVAEGRRNSVVAQEYQISLPHELTASQRLDLARKFSRDLADRHGAAIDLAIHNPRPDSDPRNFHAHLLATTREVTPAGLGAKTGLQLSFDESLRRGMGGAGEMMAIRERLATLTNDAYKAAGLELRVDHRSLADQGIDREPMAEIPWAKLQMEHRAVRLEIIERTRAQYRERIGARADNAEHQDLASSADSAERTASPEVPGAPGAEEIRRQARESWLALRREALGTGVASGAEAQSTAQAPSQAAAPSASQSASQSASDSPAAAIDEDLGL